MIGFKSAVGLVWTAFLARNPGTNVKEFLVGEKYRHENRVPGDVVFVSDGGDFSAPQPGSGAAFLGANESFTALLDLRVVSFECDCWGNDEEESEALMLGVILALDDVFGRSQYTPLDYSDITQLGNEAGYSWYGTTYRLAGNMKLLIPGEQTKTITVTGTPSTGVYNAAE